MKVGTSLLVLLMAVAVSRAQYNYQPAREDSSGGYGYDKPTPPRGDYLPPRTTQPPPPPPTTTRRPYESESDVAAEGLNPDGEHEPGMPYDFTYAVKDDYGNDFSHSAESDGEVVKGEYKTLLPDGRTQIVRYTADWKNGYNAEVTYEGEAVYPEEPVRPQPTRPPPPTQPPRRNPYETDEQIDSQGLYPSTTRAPYVPPPTTRAPYVPPPTTRAPYVPPPTTRAPYVPPTTYRTTTRPPTYRTTTLPPYRPPETTRYVPPPPPPTYRTTTLPPYRPPTTYRTTTRPPPPRTTQPPTEPPGLYGAPSLPYGVRNNPKFGYNRK